MATPKPKDAFKLPPEAKAKIMGMLPDIEKAKHGLDTMKKLGMDVKVVEDKLNWAIETRDILLKEFG